MRNSLTVSRLASIPGVNACAMARQVPTQFSEILSAITEAGIEAIQPGEKFYVKVIQILRMDYVERDIEFAAAGALVKKLAKVNALPAKNEHEADRVIQAVVGKKWAYICVRGKI